MACRLSPKELADLENLFHQGVAQGDFTAFSDALRMHLDPTFHGMVLEFWKAGLLTSPSTHAANVIGNTLNLFADVATTGLAGGVVDPVLAKLSGKGRQVYAGEAGAQLAGMRSVFRSALREWARQSGNALLARPEELDIPEVQAEINKTAGRLAKSGAGQTNMLGNPAISAKFENPRVGAIPGKAGVIVRTPFRLLESADQFFKTLISQGELMRQAYRSGTAKGLSGQSLEAHMAQLANDVQANPDAHPEIVRAMAQAALKGTFQEPYREDSFGRATHHFQQVLRDIPLLQWIVPFIRTPSNIARKTFELTPAGAIKPLLDVVKGEHGIDQSERLARAMLGTAIGGALLWAAKSGLMTGSGPTDTRKRQVKEDTGWSPYSFHVGDTYIPFARFEPLAGVASIAADLAESGDEKNAKGLALKLLAATTNAITNKTFLQGADRLFEVWSDPWRYGKTFVKGLAASAIPAGVGAIARATDDTVRDTSRGGALEQIGAAVQARIPGASRLLPARTTGFGTEVERQAHPLLRLLSPSQITQDREGPLYDLERTMLNANYIPTAPPRDVTIPGRGKVDLNEDERRLFQDGLKRATEAAIRLSRSPKFQSLPASEDEADASGRSQARAFRELFERYRDEARSRVKSVVSRRLRVVPRSYQTAP